MENDGRISELLESIRTAYGSLENPNFSFIGIRYEMLLRHPIVADIMSRYFVKNDTDMNAHAALHLRVLHDQGGLMVCLSCVDHWAMLFRLDDPLYVKVLDDSTLDLLGAERDMLKLLAEHGFKLVSRHEAATPIPLNLFDTDLDETRIYHAIVSDDGVIPEVLQYDQ